MLFFFLFYYTITFLFQFFTVGSMYASITIFLKQSFGKLLESNNAAQWLIDLTESFFDYFYIALVMMAIIISLTTTVDRGVGIFLFLMSLFGVLLLITMSGIIIYLFETGFYPPKMETQAIFPHWQITKPEERHFSVLVLSGAIMMGVFFIPMILRPLDFLSNVRNYIMGLFSYLFMMPTFINIMQIYAMCNLHDISWGNRPTTQAQGVEAVTYNVAAQEKLKQDYQVFRAYFLYFWLISNALFGGLTVYLTSSQNQQVINDGNINFIDGFALFVAGLVVFNLFALIYTLKWNCRRCCKSYYGNGKFDFAEEFKRLKQDRQGAYSTDEDDDDYDESKAFNAKETGGSVNQIFKKGEDGSISITKDNHEIDDSDNDDDEFEDANEEEKEDFLHQSMNRSSRKFTNISRAQESRLDNTQGTIMMKLNDNNTTNALENTQMMVISQHEQNQSNFIFKSQRPHIESAVSYDHNDPNGITSRGVSMGKPIHSGKNTYEDSNLKVNFDPNSFGVKQGHTNDTYMDYPQNTDQNSKNTQPTLVKRDSNATPKFTLGQAFGESEQSKQKKSVRFNAPKGM